MQPLRTMRKLRSGRRTRTTKTHRCFICDHREEILAAKPGTLMAWYQDKPFLGCRYLQRLARTTNR